MVPSDEGIPLLAVRILCHAMQMLLQGVEVATPPCRIGAGVHRHARGPAALHVGSSLAAGPAREAVLDPLHHSLRGAAISSGVHGDPALALGLVPVPNLDPDPRYRTAARALPHVRPAARVQRAVAAVTALLQALPPSCLEVYRACLIQACRQIPWYEL